MSAFVVHWGYPAIAVTVVLGNLGLPVPEETILALGGYLAWRGTLHLPLVILVGVASASAGDNLGYWIGRRLGTPAVTRYGQRVMITPARMETARAFVTRYGAFGVLTARFVPGLRFAAGPLAGAAGMRPVPFFLANVLGALIYVPYATAIGYVLGAGLGDRLERIGRTIGSLEHGALVVAAIATVTFLGVRALRRRRARGP